MTISIEQVQAIADNGAVVTETGETVGGIGLVYRDNSTGAPTWVTATAAADGGDRFVPLTGARVDGNQLVVTFDAQTINDSPRFESDASIASAEEQVLYRYYGLTPADGAPANTAGTSTGTGKDDRLASATGLSVTRSEERLQVGTERRVSGRAILRKYVVTEEVTQTFQIRREEVRVEYQSVDEADFAYPTDDQAAAGDDDGYEMILHREVPVLAVVPVERVRLVKETVSEQVTVSENLRKEQVDVDTPTGPLTH